MNRNCEDWLRSYGDLSLEQESPSIFHLYCALFTLSAALGRKVWVNKGPYKIFPNVYVILVAGSGLCRKSTAIAIAENMFKLAFPNVQLVAQKVTPEALLSILSRKFKESKRSESIIIAEELGVFIGSDVKNVPLVQLLTKLYNCPDALDYETIGRGHEICQNAFCSMLAATTPEWMRSAFPSHATEGGFTGRCLFIYSNLPRRRCAFPQMDSELFRKLAADLKQIGELSGEYKLSTDGLEWYQDWYEHEFLPTEDDLKLDGYFSRKQDTLLKIAILSNVARKANFILDGVDLSGALRLLDEAEKHLTSAIRAIHTTGDGADLNQVLYKIRIAGADGISHSDLLRSLSYKMKAVTIKEHLDTLKLSQQVKSVAKQGKGNEWTYRYFYTNDDGLKEGKT